MAGHINLMIANSALAFPVLSSGKIRAYAVTSSKRMAAAPDIPTVDEAGLGGFHASLWHAFWAPAGTPDDVVAKLSSAIVMALADADIRRQIGRQARAGHTARRRADARSARRIA